MKGLIISVFLFISVLNEVYSQEEINSSGVICDASYITDQLYNFDGGIQSGYAYLGMIDLGLGFTTHDLGLWKGGNFYFQIENVHGTTPSNDLIGDAQIASNIENGDNTYLYIAQYTQEFEQLRFKVGIQDLNEEFHVNENSGNLINSSFGIMPCASINMPVPIFPKTAFGISAFYEVLPNIALQTTFFDGDPLSLEEDEYNMNYQMSLEQGYLSVSEIHFKHRIKSLSGIIKLGFQYHSGHFSQLNDSSSIIKSNHSIYLLADQEIIHNKESLCLNAFLQAGHSPDDRNENPGYIGAGFSCSGFFKHRMDDCISVGMARAKLYAAEENKFKHETALELNYLIQIHSQITLQPDIQYIINPGINTELQNAFVGILRLSITN
jgi:porin